ncbi:MAG TPA: TRAP transporter small permease subunit [Burkholderiales bacterium]|nr:TRAP transporter small permease subunit [Burkholderiales bacterium]
MPNLNFVLPHWMYWGGLALFPLLAMYLVSQQQRRGVPREPIVFTAYLFWLTAGFAGIHRMYLKSWWGLAFVPLLIGVIYCNAEVRDVHDAVSKTFAALERARADLKSGLGDLAERGTRGAAADTPEVVRARAEVRSREADYQAAKAVSDRWYGLARDFALVIAVLMLIDALLIPGLARRRLEQEPAVAHAELRLPEVHEQGTGEDPTRALHTRFTDAIEWINVKAGTYVAYWAVISVFVYYYEVIARFLFNSPTNWVHESMFLMYGMQYMISGAYAYREDQHVRVDVVYAKLSPRGKAIADIISSVFFFIFTLTMLWTGGRFALDAVHNGETSFTEWGIQYWPVKLTIPIGAALIVLQGVSKLIKDILFVMRKEA